jgi:hypothetical protein
MVIFNWASFSNQNCKFKNSKTPASILLDGSQVCFFNAYRHQLLGLSVEHWLEVGVTWVKWMEEHTYADDLLLVIAIE